MAAVGFGTKALISSRTYTTRTSFVPENVTSALASYATLASQLGLSLSSATDNGQPPDFYVYLLQSDAILLRAVSAQFTVDTDSGSVSSDLPTFLGVKDPAGNARLRRGIVALRRAITVRYEARAGLITLEVKTRWPDLSRSLADSLLSTLDWFNREVRKTQASEERKFTEHRLSTARDDLRKAEDGYQVFLEKNRNFAASPALTFQATRWQRIVGEKQRMVESLSQAYEQARLQEVRNTPVISVVEAPANALIPDRRRTLSWAVLGASAGFLAGLLYVLSLRSLMLPNAREYADLSEIRRELGQLSKEIMHPIATAKAVWRRDRG